MTAQHNAFCWIQARIRLTTCYACAVAGVMLKPTLCYVMVGLHLLLFCCAATSAENGDHLLIGPLNMRHGAMPALRCMQYILRSRIQMVLLPDSKVQYSAVHLA